MSIEDIVSSIEHLKKEKAAVVESRIKEFEEVGKSSKADIFKELCFCLLTANFNAERAIKIQQEIGEGFLTLSKPQLAQKLRELGHRYPNARSSYIVEARPHLRNLVNKIRGINERALREWLVRNVKGLGYKEASHFLRNVGFKNVMIIDFHIVDILVRCGLIKRPKTLTPKKYLKIERKIEGIARRCGLSLAELDLYLWYMETGKILK